MLKVYGIELETIPEIFKRAKLIPGEVSIVSITINGNALEIEQALFVQSLIEKGLISEQTGLNFKTKNLKKLDFKKIKSEVRQGLHGKLPPNGSIEDWTLVRITGRLKPTYKWTRKGTSLFRTSPLKWYL